MMPVIALLRNENIALLCLLLTNGHSFVDGLAHGFQLHRRASLLLQTMMIAMTPTSLAFHEDGGNAHATLQISACLCEAAYRQQTRCIRNVVACLAWPSDAYLHWVCKRRPSASIQLFHACTARRRQQVANPNAYLVVLNACVILSLLVEPNILIQRRLSLPLLLAVHVAGTGQYCTWPPDVALTP
jgi:hypothetical protein